MRWSRVFSGSRRWQRIPAAAKQPIPEGCAAEEGRTSFLYTEAVPAVDDDAERQGCGTMGNAASPAQRTLSIFLRIWQTGCRAGGEVQLVAEHCTQRRTVHGLHDGCLQELGRPLSLHQELECSALLAQARRVRLRFVAVILDDQSGEVRVVLGLLTQRAERFMFPSSSVSSASDPDQRRTGWLQ